jgi:cytochrome c-type biogenesis protein CcmE
VKRTYIIVLFFIAICIGVVASQLGNVSSYAHFGDRKLKAGKEVRLKGTLATNQPVVYDPVVDPNSFSFYLVDEKGEVGKVVCFDEKPRDFEKSDEIVITGTQKDDVFYASDLLVKCPSKYVEEEIEKKEI